MQNPLAWYIAGPLIGLIVPLLLLLREKQFGISSSYRYIWSHSSIKNEYFSYKSAADAWQLQFAIGLILIGIAFFCFTEGPQTGQAAGAFAQVDFYSLKYWPNFLMGGIFVGFGARYANGCTAGHCIMGMAQLSIASLIATIGFFVGGLLVAYLLNPILLK